MKLMKNSHGLAVRIKQIRPRSHQGRKIRNMKVREAKTRERSPKKMAQNQRTATFIFKTIQCIVQATRMTPNQRKRVNHSTTKDKRRERAAPMADVANREPGRPSKGPCHKIRNKTINSLPAGRHATPTLRQKRQQERIQESKQQSTSRRFSKWFNNKWPSSKPR